MSEERRRLIKKVLVLSWGRDGGEEACSVSGATDGDGGGSWTGRRRRGRYLRFGESFSRSKDQKERCLVGVLAPDARSTLREGVYTWVKV